MSTLLYYISIKFSSQKSKFVKIYFKLLQKYGKGSIIQSLKQKEPKMKPVAEIREKAAGVRFWFTRAAKKSFRAVRPKQPTTEWS